MINALIVDDEPLARENLILRLAKFKGFQVCGQADNGHDAVLLSSRLQPDVIFFDINMPGLSGIEAAKKLINSQDVLIIFVTAYNDHAIEAFRLNALDYLVKPIDDTHFEETIKRIQRRVSQKTKLAGLINIDQGYLKRLAIKDGHNIHMIDVNTIESIEATGDYLSLSTKKRKYLHKQPLKILMSLLDPDCFVRIHRSYAVNKGCLDKLVNEEETLFALLKNGQKLIISRRYRKIVKEQIIKNLPHTD